MGLIRDNQGTNNFKWNIKTWLKIPTGRRRTSWLFYKLDRGFELGTTENKSSWRYSKLTTRPSFLLPKTEQVLVFIFHNFTGTQTKILCLITGITSYLAPQSACLLGEPLQKSRSTLQTLIS